MVLETLCFRQHSARENIAANAATVATNSSQYPHGQKVFFLTMRAREQSAQQFLGQGGESQKQTNHRWEYESKYQYRDATARRGEKSQLADVVV